MSLRLLLVEDNELFRELIKSALSEYDVEVTEASGFMRALKALEAGEFDCALVDLNLPDGDGMALLGAEPELPMVFLTGTAAEASVIQAIQAGAEDYLIKTALGQDIGRELTLAVRKAIERFRHRQDLRQEQRRLSQALDQATHERKRLEQQVEESSHLLNQSPLGYVTLDRSGRILEANDAACALLGYSRQLLILMPIAACLSRESISPFLRHLWEVFAGTPTGEIQVFLRTGRPQTALQVSCWALSNNTVRVAFADLTRETSIRRALSASHAAARAVVDTPRDVVLEVDQTGRIVSGNVAFRLIFGDSASLLLSDLLPGLELSEGHCEWTARRASGELFQADVVVSRLTNWVVVVRDLAEDWRVLRDLLDVAETERRRLGQELHDNLGQRLAAMGFVASSLAQRLGPDGDTVGNLARRLVELCRQTTAETRMMSQGLFPAELEINGLLSALQRLGRDLEQIYSIRCRMDLQECGFAPGAPSVHIYRIVQEAMHNAIKHGQAQSLTVRLERGSEYVQLVIADDGRGMVEETLGSTRLGIISMRHHSQMLGGTLELLPNYPQGMLVRCDLPLPS